MTQLVIPNFGTTMDDLIPALERKFIVTGRTTKTTEDDLGFIGSYFPKYETGSERIRMKEKAYIQNKTTGDTGVVHDWDTVRVCEPTISLEVRDRRTVNDVIEIVAEVKAADTVGKYLVAMHKVNKQVKVDFKDIGYLMDKTYPLLFRTKKKANVEKMQKDFSKKLETVVMQEGLKIYSQMIAETIVGLEKPTSSKVPTPRQQNSVLIAR